MEVFDLSSKREEAILSKGMSFRLALMPAKRLLRSLLFVICSLMHIYYDYNRSKVIPMNSELLGMVSQVSTL